MCLLQDRQARPIKFSSTNLAVMGDAVFKRCWKCEDLKVQDQKFGSLRSSSDGFAPICKECDIQCNSAKREKNPLQVSHLSHSAAVRRFCSRHSVFTYQQCHPFHEAFFFHFIVSALAPWCWCYNKLRQPSLTCGVQRAASTASVPSRAWCSRCKERKPAEAFCQT